MARQLGEAAAPSEQRLQSSPRATRDVGAKSSRAATAATAGITAEVADGRAASSRADASGIDKSGSSTDQEDGGSENGDGDSENGNGDAELEALLAALADGEAGQGGFDEQSSQESDRGTAAESGRPSTSGGEGASGTGAAGSRAARGGSGDDARSSRGSALRAAEQDFAAAWREQRQRSGLVGALLALAYPDRIARRQSGGGSGGSRGASFMLSAGEAPYNQQTGWMDWICACVSLP